MMVFFRPVQELIKMRTSIRTFDGRALEPNDLREMEALVDEINDQSRENSHFQIVDLGQTQAGRKQKLGTYGVISGARQYLVGLVDPAQHDALDFGFRFEKVILKATDLGIGTCWLGGTFNKGELARYLDLTSQLSIPIISPLGYARSQSRFLETAMRKVVKADQRKPWADLFFAADGKTPLNQTDVGLYAQPLEMVRLGPSASNKQPWRVIYDNRDYHFFLCRNKGYGVPGYDMQMNDIGIAMCHFELSAREASLDGQWEMCHVKARPKDSDYVISWKTADF